MDLQNLLKDKRFLLAAAAAAGIGVLIMIRRKNSGAAGDGSDDPATDQTGGKAFNTTGTDVASWAGDYFKSINEYLAQIAAAQRPSQTGDGEASPTTAPHRTPEPAPKRIPWKTFGATTRTEPVPSRWGG